MILSLYKMSQILLVRNTLRWEILIKSETFALHLWWKTTSFLAQNSLSSWQLLRGSNGDSTFQDWWPEDTPWYLEELDLLRAGNKIPVTYGFWRPHSIFVKQQGLRSPNTALGLNLPYDNDSSLLLPSYLASYLYFPLQEGNPVFYVC